MGELKCRDIVIYSVFLLALQGNALADGKIREPRSIEISAAKLDWVMIGDSNVSKEAIRSFPAAIKDSLRDGHIGFAATIDIDGDGLGDLIATTSESYSGGKIYSVILNRGKAWKYAGNFQGGFSLRLDGKSDYYRITSYYRSGDVYQHDYDFRKGRYRLTNETRLASAISRSCLWNILWFELNAPRVAAKSAHKKDSETMTSAGSSVDCRALAR